MNDLQISGFEMIEKIGEGGMASVWKARQLSLDRTVAIKILSSRMATDPTDILRFQTEAQSAAKLKHPGIVQVYDANVEDGAYYFVMEYVAGYTVGDWLRRKSVLSEKDTLLIADCVADALEYSWDKAGIIHCDIKPDNVMIDSDGTVKVADLGLARTISAMSDEESSDEVMGTPSYISPEQARGDPDLDCRADIYSLGAMLYHMITGRLLFESEADESVMDLQIAGVDPDPMDVNPQVSKSLCWLIEKMLAKDKEDRHSSWQSVRADIARVKKGYMPHGRPIPQGSSTIDRNELRTPLDFVQAVQSRPDKASKLPLIITLAALGLIALVVAVIVLWMDRTQDPPVRPRGPTTVSVVKVPKEDADRNAREMYEFVKKWVQSNPKEYDEAIKRFMKVVEQTRGTKYALMAEEQVVKLSNARREGITRVMEQLVKKTAYFIGNKEFGHAIQIYESYSGELAAESKKTRERAVDKIRDHVKRLEQESQHAVVATEDKFEEVLDKVATELVGSGILSAVSAVRDAMNDSNLADKRGALSDIDKLLRDAARVNERVLDSFQKQKGDTIAVRLSTGTKSIQVVDVRDGKVIANQKVGARGSATAPITFEIQDLSPRERLLRMGSDDLPDVALVKGLMALNSKAYSHAKKYFGATHPLIAGKLVEKTEAVERDSAGENAKVALGLLMRSIGIQVGVYDRNAWLEAVRNKKFSVDSARRVKDLVAEYRRKYGDTGFASEAEAILNALLQKMPAGTSSSPDQAGEPTIAATKTASGPGADPASVRKSLLKRNRGLAKGDMTFRPEDEEIVRALDIESRMIEDISPIADLSSLNSFSCVNWQTEPGEMKDLSPLENLPLERLNIRNYPVSDIGMLRKMPLKSVCLAKSNVRDISALKGMRLEEVDLSGTKVFDFSVLAGMPIRRLRLNDTQLKNLSFVKGMPLEHLEIRNTRVYDFSLLGKMELKHLDVAGTQIRSLDVLKGAPLVTLIAYDTNINNIAPLSGMQLSHLNINGTLVKKFSVLSDLPLKQLHVSDTRIKDLELLRGLSLTVLSLSETKVRDLSPLEGMFLQSLALDNTRIDDLRPLEGMPLKHFSCREIAADNFSALKKAPIERLWITNPAQHRSFVDSLPELRYLNGKWVRDG